MPLLEIVITPKLLRITGRGRDEIKTADVKKSAMPPNDTISRISSTVLLVDLYHYRHASIETALQIDYYYFLFVGRPWICNLGIVIISRTTILFTHV